MHNPIFDLLSDNPIIAAIKDDKGLQRVINSSCNIVFVLYGNILTIPKIVDKLKKAGKYAFVHVDLLEGTSSKDIVIDYIKHTTQADGIISTKSSMIRAAKSAGLHTVYRFFLIDSMSYHNVPKQVLSTHPDCIEVLPGCMPKILKRIKNTVNVPVIAGGLISDKEDVLNALDSGSVAISSTCPDIWDNI